MSLHPNLVVHCSKCEKHVTMVERGDWLDADEQDSDFAILHTLGSCPVCDSVFLLKHRSRPEQIDPYKPDFRWWGDAEVLYPHRHEVLDDAVPTAISAAYAEAAKTQEAGAHTATAIMCRRTLEGICAHYGEVDGGSLASKLKKLRDNEVIEPRIYEWASSVLKDLGNDAAHNVDEVITAEDAGAALDFTRAILEYLFVFGAAFERFKERRTNREKRTRASTSVPGTDDAAL